MSPSPPDDLLAVAVTLEGVPSAYAATLDGIDALLRDRGLRRTTPDDTGRALLLGAAATAGLEGDEVAPDDLAAGHGGPTARAALRLSTELLSLAPVWRRSPVQAIARIHALAAAGSEPDDQLGRPMTPEGAGRLAVLGQLVQRPTPAPGLVVAALAHAEIVAAAAFASHNGVVGRAVERLVMVTSGVDRASVLVPEAGHAREADGYRAAASAYARGDTVGLHQWLNYAAAAFSRAAEASPVG